MSTKDRRRILVWLAWVLVTTAAPAAASRTYDFSGAAFVQDDGSLRIRNRDVRLWGIQLLETRRDCLHYVRPPVCGPRAVLALREGIAGFVRCATVNRAADGVIEAQCFSGYDNFDDGVDLAAYLLNRGWALAGADAPPHYHALESLARHHGVGLWGSPRATKP